MKDKPTYHELEKLLKAQEEKFKQLLKNSFDMIVLLDSNGIQRYVSESCQKILGYSPQELTDVPVIEQMIHPEDQKKTLEGFQGILQKKAHGGTQYRHRHKNGGWVYLEAFGTNQLDNPHIHSIVLNVRDITERKQAEKALKESEARLSELNAAKDRFFSIIAHDLKSPFSNVAGLSELLAEQIHDKNYGELENLASLIQQSVQRASGLLSNLLQWAQTQTGRMSCQPEKFSLKRSISETLELLCNVASRKEITLTADYPEDLVVFADKNMVNTILRNLLSNAVKFSYSGGEVFLKVQKENNRALISVTDKGIGMTRENLQKLFKIQFRHSTTGTEKETGTGLGLLLCKEFVDLHQGKIWVESTINKGSTFYFTLPLA